MNTDKETILHEVMGKSTAFWSVKFIHASGHGGQHKDHGNSKVQLTFDVERFFEVFELDEKKRDKFVEVVGKKNIHHKNTVVILENQEQRSAKMNEENVLKHLRHMLSEVLEEDIERKETKVPYIEKKKRLNDKNHHSKKKDHRKKTNIE